MLYSAGSDADPPGTEIFHPQESAFVSVLQSRAGGSNYSPEVHRVLQYGQVEVLAHGQAHVSSALPEVVALARPKEAEGLQPLDVVGTNGVV